MHCFNQVETDTIVQVKHKRYIKGASGMNLWGCARDLIVIPKVQVEYPLEFIERLIRKSE